MSAISANGNLVAYVYLRKKSGVFFGLFFLILNFFLVFYVHLNKNPQCSLVSIFYVGPNLGSETNPILTVKLIKKCRTLINMSLLGVKGSKIVIVNLRKKNQSVLRLLFFLFLT